MTNSQDVALRVCLHHGHDISEIGNDVICLKCGMKLEEIRREVTKQA